MDGRALTLICRGVVALVSFHHSPGIHEDLTHITTFSEKAMDLDSVGPVEEMYLALKVASIQNKVLVPRRHLPIPSIGRSKWPVRIERCEKNGRNSRVGGKV